MKKLLPVIYLLAFAAGIFLVVTSDTGLITSYCPAIVAGAIISIFAGIFLAIYLHACHKNSK